MPTTPFADVVVGSPTAEPDSTSTVKVVWQLNADVNAIWQDCFNAAEDPREGPMGYVHGPGPRVAGRTVVWTVPIAVLENANRVVRAKTQGANVHFRAKLATRDREHGASEKRQQANADAAKQAQTILDNFD